MNQMRAIGMMSGTSLDGVDVALVETDGERIGSFGPTGYRPYTEHERDLLRSALTAASTLRDREQRPGVIGEAERVVTVAHAQAIELFLAANRIDPSDVDVIGFHGQTVLHRPASRLTVQIGDGHELARRTGIPVVFDFRAADVAAGGQGAPLVPVFHRALARHLERPRPVAVLNIGGVSNVTFIDGERDPVACDTGPGNALIDDFMRARTGEAKDHDGASAAMGQVDQAFVARVLSHPFFDAPPPKSLDRNAFAFANLELPSLSLADGAATLTALTTESVARVVRHLPRPPMSWVVAGGGSRNRTLIKMLGARLAPASVERADDIGWSGDALEAQAFAFLAVRSRRDLPLTYPSTTGVGVPMRGGGTVRPSANSLPPRAPAADERPSLPT